MTSWIYYVNEDWFSIFLKSMVCNRDSIKKKNTTSSVAEKLFDKIENPLGKFSNQLSINGIIIIVRKVIKKNPYKISHKMVKCWDHSLLNQQKDRLPSPLLLPLCKCNKARKRNGRINIASETKIMCHYLKRV